MRQTVRLGRIAGIPLGMHWSVLVVVLLLAEGLATVILPASAPGRPGAAYWVVGIVIAVLFVGALLAHELAHALVARHYRVPVRSITLWLLGGMTELDGTAPHARGELLIALAGPLTSLGAGAVCAGLAAGGALVGADALIVGPLAWLAAVNLLVGVFNLLPGAPLDGGRVLTAAVWWIRGDQAAARRVAGRAGVVIGLLMMLAGGLEVFYAGQIAGLWLVLVGWFMAGAATAESGDATVRERLAGRRVADIMSAPVCGYGWQTVDVFVATLGESRPRRAFPVLDFGGDVLGVVDLPRLTRVPAERRGEVRLDTILVPVTRVTILSPDTPLIDALAVRLPGRYPMALVRDAGRLVGVVEPQDLAWAAEMAGLRPLPRQTDQSRDVLSRDRLRDDPPPEPGPPPPVAGAPVPGTPAPPVPGSGADGATDPQAGAGRDRGAEI